MKVGPEIVTDNLVFGYDTGYPSATNAQSLRFNKGEPTVNISSTHHASGHNTGNYGNVVTVADAPEKGTGWKKVTISNRGSNFRILQWQYTSHTSNVLYAHSAIFDWGNMRDKGYYITFDGNGGGTRNYFPNGDESTNGGGTITSSLKDGKFSSNITKSGTHVHAWFIYHSTTGVSGLNDYFYYNEYQVEINTHSTPYTSGTRSSTQGLLDLKETTDIDVDDVSFDSNAQLSFDGTDDHITINNPDISADSFTIQMVVKPDSYSNNPMLINPNSTGIDQYIRIWSNGKIGGVFVAAADTSGDTCKSSTSLSTSEYTHFTITKSPSAIKVYINGNLETTVTPTVSAAAWTGTWDIGQRVNNTYNYNGVIPILKVYNTPISADEVKINFNSIKNRFGI